MLQWRQAGNFREISGIILFTLTILASTALFFILNIIESCLLLNYVDFVVAFVAIVIIVAVIAITTIFAINNISFGLLHRTVSHTSPTFEKKNRTKLSFKFEFYTDLWIFLTSIPQILFALCTWQSGNHLPEHNILCHLDDVLRWTVVCAIELECMTATIRNNVIIMWRRHFLFSSTNIIRFYDGYFFLFFFVVSVGLPLNNACVLCVPLYIILMVLLLLLLYIGFIVSCAHSWFTSSFSISWLYLYTDMTNSFLLTYHTYCRKTKLLMLTHDILTTTFFLFFILFRVTTSSLFNEFQSNVMVLKIG